MLNEREHSSSESNRLKLEQINNKNKIEIESIKLKFFEDLQSSTNQYETKITNLNLK